MLQETRGWWWIVLPIVLLTLFLARFILVARILLFVFVGLGLIGWLGLSVYRFVQSRRNEKSFLASPEGMTKEKITHCQAQIKNLQAEVKKLQAERQELTQKLSTTPSANATTKEESKKLIQTFSKEIQLREQKIDFLQTCISQLEQMLANYQLSETILKKRAILEKQKEVDLETSGDLEEIRSQIEYQRRYFTTLDELSSRLDKSHSAEHLNVLQKELNDLSDQIRKQTPKA